MRPGWTMTNALEMTHRNHDLVAGFPHRCRWLTDETICNIPSYFIGFVCNWCYYRWPKRLMGQAIRLIWIVGYSFCRRFWLIRSSEMVDKIWFTMHTRERFSIEFPHLHKTSHQHNSYCYNHMCQTSDNATRQHGLDVVTTTNPAPESIRKFDSLAYTRITQYIR